jgi:hypothetical protein
MTDIDIWRDRLDRLDAAGRERLRDNAARQAETSDPKKAAAAGEALSALDAYEAEQREGDRVAAEGPLADRVKRSFENDVPSEAERKVLQAIMDRPGSTSAALSARIGYKGQTWHLKFGTMCAARQDVLGPALDKRKDGSPFWTGVLCDFDEASSTFTLKPEAEEGLRAIGFKPHA